MAEKSAWCPTSRTGWESASEVPKEAVMGECRTSDIARNQPEEMPGRVFTGRYLTSLKSSLRKCWGSFWHGVPLAITPWELGIGEVSCSVVSGVEKLCVLQGLDSGKTMA